ncbi:MAG TPA: cob(I)yrinic acid a,c-diamide adenosyltransferase [Verrucomicrobiae bacterium]|nr:cob(I)yrinic acid a,c-diamide adenosyltransferase [Verrucomicrobiae bacterium]
MSIVTRTGDSGTTALMYGRRVPKNHPRVEAYGAVDELNAALGLARATTTENFVGENLLAIQKDLITLMGELCVQPEDLKRYVEDGYSLVTTALTAKLDALVKEIEAQKISFKGWATPGATHNSAALDMARTICRRAERRVCDLKDTGEAVNSEIVIYLNRLSDLLWLFARWVETKSGVIGK